MKTNLILITLMIMCFTGANLIKNKSATSPKSKGEKTKMSKKTLVVLSLYEVRNLINKYDNKIEKLSKEIKPATFKEGTAATIIGDIKLGKITEKEFKETAAAKLQSLNAMKANRNKLKAILVYSNATQQIEVNEKKYTLSEAIERESYVEYEIQTLETINNEYMSNKRNVIMKNNIIIESMEKEKAVRLTEIKDPTRQQEIIVSTEKYYAENKQVVLVEAIDGGWEKYYEEAKKEMVEFKDTIKTKLMITNCNIKVEIDLAGE